MYPTTLVSNGIYVFTTSVNITYYCRFSNCTNRLSPVLGVYDIKIYELDFYRVLPEDLNIQDKKADPEVASTLIQLSLSVTDDQTIVVAVCDSSDGREKARQSLFKKWHQQYLSLTVTLIPLEIDIENETTIYAVLFVPKTFPHMDILQWEINNNAEDIIAQKY